MRLRNSKDIYYTTNIIFPFLSYNADVSIVFPFNRAVMRNKTARWGHQGV